MSNQAVRAGDVFVTTQNCQCVVMDYRGSKDVIVRFLDGFGHEMSVTVSNLQRGSVKNPYHRSVYGVGMVGVGPHKMAVGVDHAKSSRVWRSMLKRCYDDKFHLSQPTYAECTVHPDWHNFQNFAEWHCQQPNWDSPGFDLDKDIISRGNKEYGPENCAVVPSVINRIFGEKKKADGLPPGVIWVKSEGKYLASCNDGRGRQIKIGRFDCPELAFLEYKAFKEAVIKREALAHRDLVDNRIFDALINYEVLRH